MLESQFHLFRYHFHYPPQSETSLRAQTTMKSIPTPDLGPLGLN